MPDEASRIYEYLKRLIRTSAIGVTHIDGGAIKEYFIDIDGGAYVSFLISRGEINDVIHYNYVITIDDEVLAAAVISSRAKHLTLDESRIVDLFELCSARIIFQETKLAIQKTNDATKQNTYFN